MRAFNCNNRISAWLVLSLTCVLLASRHPCGAQETPKNAEDCEKPGAKATSKDAKGEKQNKVDDSMQKAMAEAQSAYEKEQRELKQRLEKDPAWQPSHENVAVIKPGKGPIESFCRNKDGNLLICCSGEQSTFLGGLLGGQSNSQRGRIFVFSPKGKKIAEWKVPMPPQAICLGDDGVIYVAGGGRIASLDQSGKVVAEADTPNAGELPPVPVVKKEPKKTGPEAEKAAKARKEKIARLTKEMRQAQADYTKAAVEGQKNLKPNDDGSMADFQEKLKAPMEKLQAVQQELQEATLTPEMRAAQARAARERLASVTGMAVTDRDLFVCCASTKGYGYVVWRTDHNFGGPKKIVENLAGCCGQMDIQAHGGDLWVAHNSRHKVEHYNRDGKKLVSFGKTDRASADGFGGCCEPKNLRFAPGDVVLACESGPPTCVKRYTLAGKFLGVSLVAPWNSGCVRVTTEYDAEHDRYFVLNSGEQQIHVFAKKPASPPPAATTSLKSEKDVN
jgi:hypothetical protein